jgi:hypothetical protein
MLLTTARGVRRTRVRGRVASARFIDGREGGQLMAKLHERMPADDQLKLMGWCRVALKDSPPTLSIPELGNNVMSLCEKHLRDTEAGVELECDLRELFAELLEIPLDSFNAESGGIPRRLFAAMLARHRKKNAQIAKENSIPEEDGGEAVRLSEHICTDIGC